MLLPKGIVTNSSELEGSIYKIDNQPLDQDDIAKLWKVYTTTQRRLLDPTAERLENLWWRIWGSRSRQLRGAVVARLFAQISDGHSLTSLRGPSDREERLFSMGSKKSRGDSSATALKNCHPQFGPDTTSSVAPKGSVPRPHPILKKRRGPSVTGPRPTARFISPHESQDEMDTTFFVDATTSAARHHPNNSAYIDSQGQKCDQKPVHTNRKKANFVTFVGKRRPMTIRRPSSQTSQSSVEGTSRSTDRTAVDTSISGIQSISKWSSPSSIVQAHKSQRKFPMGNLLSFESTPMMHQASLKGKTSRAGDDDMMKDCLQVQRVEGVVNENGPEVPNTDGDPSSQPGHAEISRELKESIATGHLSVVDFQSSLPTEITQQQAEQDIDKLARDFQNPARPLQHTYRSKSEGKLSAKTKSKAILAPTLAAVNGQLVMGKVQVDNATPWSRYSSVNLKYGKERDHDEFRSFAKSTAPTDQAIYGARLSEDLSRSKSQLTMVLERDRTRIREPNQK